MDDLFSVPHDPAVASPAIIRGDAVIVRRLRGVGRGEIELNPAHPWSVKVQAPTWNTLLDLTGLEVADIKLDSGAVRVECVLPRPHGVVPIHVSSGVYDVRLRRPPGVPVLAEVSTGVVQLTLDAFGSNATTSDLRWESHPGAATAAATISLTCRAAASRSGWRRTPRSPTGSRTRARRRCGLPRLQRPKLCWTGSRAALAERRKTRICFRSCGLTHCDGVPRRQRRASPGSRGSPGPAGSRS